MDHHEMTYHITINSYSIKPFAVHIENESSQESRNVWLFKTNRHTIRVL